MKLIVVGSGQQFARKEKATVVRLTDCRGKWLRECATIKEVKEAVGKQRFLNTFPIEKSSVVSERK